MCYSPIITSGVDKRALQIEGMLRDLRFRTSRCGILPYFQPFWKNAKEDAIA